MVVFRLQGKDVFYVSCPLGRPVGRRDLVIFIHSTIIQTSGTTPDPSSVSVVQGKCKVQTVFLGEVSKEGPGLDLLGL